MAFSDLCQISNAYKTLENEADQSDRIMEENSMVRDLITKILDETGPSESSSSLPPSEKTISGLPSSPQYPKSDVSNASFMPSMFSNSYNNIFSNNYSQPENNFNNFNISNGFGQNGFTSYDNDVNSLLNLDPITDVATETVSPEQLNLLRLAAQEIGGAQFTSPNKFDENIFNFFEPNQRNSLPETNMFSSNNFNRPNSLNLDMNYNSNFDGAFNNSQRFSNQCDNSYMKEQSQDANDILSYISNLNINMDRPREDPMPNNMDFKMPDMNGPYQNEDYSKLVDDRNKMYYNRNFQQVPPNKNFNNDFFINEVMSQMNDRNHGNQNYDYANQTPVSVPNSLNFKPNGYQQNDYIRNQMMARDNFPMNDMRGNFEGLRDHNQQLLMRQNQELARQMSILMRNRPPPHQLNVDVSFLHENAPFNLGVGGLLGGGVGAPVLASPMLDLPLLAPFYAMRSMRGAVTSSSILHLRLDACYEQWRQLERERKRTEARLALAFPGRCVSSSNSIPVPRLPHAPTRVDRLTVDMLREHTKVLTLMGKMETLRASVCVAQNKKPNQKQEDSKITVLKRGQENVASDKEKEASDPEKFEPASWKDDVKNLSEIAPHSEVEGAMLAWRGAVAAVQAARRKELTNKRTGHDPILQLAECVKALCSAARRARCAMWCDLTLTVALAPQHQHQTETTQNNATPATKQDSSSTTIKQSSDNKDSKKEDKQSTEQTPPKDTKTETNNNKVNNKQPDNKDKNPQLRRSQNYRKVNNNNGRNDFYQKRYDNRFMHNRPPYYLATGPIN